MPKYKTLTLYIGTAELAESFKKKAKATFGTPSAMIQAIAKGEAVVVKVDLNIPQNAERAERRAKCEWLSIEDRYFVTECGRASPRLMDGAVFCPYCAGIVEDGQSA